MNSKDSASTATSFVDILRRRAVDDGSRIAFSWLDDSGHDTDRLTYFELDRQAQAVAGRLQTLDGYGRRALLVFPPGLSFISAFFGCLYAGTIAVPSSTPRRHRADERLSSIARNSQADFLLSTSNFTSRKADYCNHNSDLAGLAWLAVDQIISSSESSWQYPKLSRDNIALLQYTSGSTADPKGVIITHDNLLANQARLTAALKTDAEDVYVSWIPFFHDLGLIGAITGAVYVGCRSFHFSPAAFLQNPRLWLEAITRFKGTLTTAPNFAFDLCVRAIGPEERVGLNLRSLRAAVNAAEPVRAETQDRFVMAFESCGFHHDQFAPTYGLAEATLFVSGGVLENPPLVRSVSIHALREGTVVPVPPNDSASKKFVACGAVRDQSGIKIVDPDSLIECDQNRVGEIWVRNSHISPGYWNQPEESRAAFQAYLKDSREGPFLRTSDLGFILDDHLFVSGRLKDIIIIHGSNYYPQDIELSIQKSHPALQRGSGAAFGIDSGYEELLVVAQEVKRKYRNSYDIGEIAAAARRAVALDHGIALDGLILVAPLKISKTTSGKIRRLAAREAFIDGTLAILDQWLSDRLQGEGIDDTKLTYPTPFQISSDSAVDGSQIRDWIHWRLSKLPEALDTAVRLDKPFTDYGLDSIVLIQLVNELAEWLGTSVELAILWDLPTIESLIEHLATELARQHASEISSAKAAVTSAGEKISPAEADRILKKIDELSEAEIDDLLRLIDSEEDSVED